MKKFLMIALMLSTPLSAAHEDLDSEILILEEKLQQIYQNINTPTDVRLPQTPQEQIKYLKVRLDIIELKLEGLLQEIGSTKEAQEGRPAAHQE